MYVRAFFRCRRFRFLLTFNKIFFVSDFDNPPELQAAVAGGENGNSSISGYSPVIKLFPAGNQRERRLERGRDQHQPRQHNSLRTFHRLWTFLLSCWEIWCRWSYTSLTPDVSASSYLQSKMDFTLRQISEYRQDAKHRLPSFHHPWPAWRDCAILPCKGASQWYKA